MTELIVAMDSNGGIGLNNHLPWHNPAELAIFREKTMGKTVVLGRRTFEGIPSLPGRKIICLSRNRGESTGITSILDIATVPDWRTTTIVAGGAQVYELALTTRLEGEPLVRTIHMSVMDGEHECDTYFDPRWLDGFVIVSTENGDGFIHHTMERTTYGEHQYLSLVRDLLGNGKAREGRNGPTLGRFKSDFTFDLQNGFPLLTSRKMFLRGIVEEFIFFITGQTDSTILSEKKVRIWEGNTTSEFLVNRGLDYAPGVMGPMYGYQWRHYNAPYRVGTDGRPLEATGGMDQLARVVDLIKTDPSSRRILMTVYNPCQAEQGVLYPCHSITIQFYVDDQFLDMFCYNRSQDVALGVPFNIASSSLLLTTVANLTNKTPRFLHMTMGDTHIYEQHATEIASQLSRIPYKFPTLTMRPLKSLDDLTLLTASDFVLVDYSCHPPIKMAMVA
jgi:dihydrofolate reductase / thymidylate synthase